MTSKLVTYYNNGSLPLSQAADFPYTTVNLAFIMTNAANPTSLMVAGAIAQQSSPPVLTQTTVDAINELKAAGKSVLISFGGATMSSVDYAEIVGKEAELAEGIADFVTQYQLDGVDVDWEDTAAFTGQAGYDGVSFLVTLTKALRVALPQGALITHAPQPPYMQEGSGMEGYIAVMARAGEEIDWINMQFYNNPPWNSDPGQIINSYHAFSQLPGMSPEKLLIGLPVMADDAGSGYMPIEEIISDVIKPLQSQGTLGGLMNWQFSSDNNGTWAKSIGAAINLM